MAKPRQPLVYGGRVTLEGDMQIATLHIDSPLLYRAALKHLEGRVTVTIAPEEQIRSLRAHNYLFAAVYAPAIQAIVDAGMKRYTRDELHHIFKERHNPITILDPFTGEEKRVGGSTKKLPIDRFSVFIEETMVDLATLTGMSFEPPRKHEEYREGQAV